MGLFALGLQAAEAGWIPDPLIRAAIRRLLQARRRSLLRLTPAQHAAEQDQLAAACASAPVAVETARANEQHYEVPASFFERVLGPHRKYSSGHWPPGVDTLRDAEAAALRETCEHAQLADGQAILELGCGWGSLSLWMAEQFPGARITAISNSHSQRACIERAIEQRGLRNLTIQTADINSWAPEGRFDRVVSVEMFEHLRNHAALLRRISDWLTPEGRLFVHIFCHRTTTYLFTDQGEQDWMSRWFFTGGLMPAEDWLSRFDDALMRVQSWRWNGRHYARTCEAWLQQLDAAQDDVAREFETVYGPGQGRLWVQRWRMFFMACAELFAYADGEEWFVSHALFARAS
jgi:cyclopropane-fatty-acyl-phospholipid synthase